MSNGPTIINLDGNTLVQGYFSGIGEDLTGLNAANLASGTVPDLRLSGNVTLQGNLFNAAGQLVHSDNSGVITLVRQPGGDRLINFVDADGTTVLGQVGFSDFYGLILSTAGGGTNVVIATAGRINLGARSQQYYTYQGTASGWYRIISSGPFVPGNQKISVMAQCDGNYRNAFTLILSPSPFGLGEVVVLANAATGSGNAVTAVRLSNNNAGAFFVDIQFVDTNPQLQVTCLEHPWTLLGFEAGPTVGPDYVVTMDLPAAGSAFSGNICLGVAGSGLQIKEGSNARSGQATLSGGTATVTNTSVTANTRFALTPHGSTINAVGISAVSAGTSFTIKSSSAGDTNAVDWMMWEPA